MAGRFGRFDGIGIHRFSRIGFQRCEEPSSHYSPTGGQAISAGSMAARDCLRSVVKLHSLIERHNSRERARRPVKLMTFAVADVFDQSVLPSIAGDTLR